MEREYLQKGHLTPLGNYVTSFYGLYKTNKFMEEEAEVKFISNEILNKIAYFCTTAPRRTLNGELNEQEYPPLSEKGNNMVIDLWLGRMNGVCAERNFIQSSEAADKVAMILTKQDINNNGYQSTLLTCIDTVLTAVSAGIWVYAHPLLYDILMPISNIEYLPLNSTIIFTSLAVSLALIAYRDYLPAVISNPVHGLYNSVTGFRDMITAQKLEPRENRI
ncbi:hypothetical protein H1Q59_04090 [Holosporaceae bacterium 'Namur']|nr:hypothetical protein [Holosporaceae bacterium 'Namur']